jgi:hypothetical protein
VTTKRSLAPERDYADAAIATFAAKYARAL